MKKSILLLAKGFPPALGGVESYSKSLADAYSRQGQSVYVLTAFADKSQAVSVDVPYKWKAILGKNQLMLFIQFFVNLLFGRFRGQSYDMIHATTWRTALPAVLIYPKTTLVVTCHGNEILQNGRIEVLMKHVLKRASLIVCVSDYTKGLLVRRIPELAEKTIRAWNGVGFQTDKRVIAEKWSSNLPQINILTVCRHEPRKNLSVAIQAVSQLKVKVQYKIAGRGILTALLQKQIESLNTDNITLLGRVDDEALAALYSESHIFLHPQIEILDNGDVEGFGLAVADAMLFACVPVVGGNGGTAELITDGVTGASMSACDIAETHKILKSLLANMNETKMMAERASAYAQEHFSWDKHVAVVLEELKLA